MILCVSTTPAVQRILFCDQLRVNEANRATDSQQCAAGKAINAARVLKSLGEQPLVLSFLGGQAGAFIRADLAVVGINCDVVELAIETRTCVTVIDRTRSTAMELVEQPAPVDAAGWKELSGRFADLLTKSEWVVLSGSLPPQAPQDFYAECVRAANARRVPVIVDTGGEPLARAIAARPLIVKPNREEFAKATGREIVSMDSLREAARDACSSGPAHVIVTLGADGALLADKDRAWHVLVPRTKTVSAIGSGDSFTAGLVTGLRRGQHMTEAVRLGAACGVANALSPRPGDVRPADAERIARDVRVEASD